MRDQQRPPHQADAGGGEKSDTTRVRLANRERLFTRNSVSVHVTEKKHILSHTMGQKFKKASCNTIKREHTLVYVDRECVDDKSV
jgi:hypothetical protein